MAECQVCGLLFMLPCLQVRLKEWGYGPFLGRVERRIVTMTVDRCGRNTALVLSQGKPKNEPQRDSSFFDMKGLAVMGWSSRLVEQTGQAR